MTEESTGSNEKEELFDADTHEQDVRKSYYHTFDDDAIDRMKKYFKVEQDHETLIRYLKDRKVPTTTPNDV